MHQKVLKILGDRRLASIATVRADGWPQSTMIGYANDGLLLYFLVSRQSQKFANLERDGRAALTIAGDYIEIADICGLSIAATVAEVRDIGPRETALRLLATRHPKFAELGMPGMATAALMRATPTIITVVDFSLGVGHADVVTVGSGGQMEMQPARPDDWGLAPSAERQPEIQWRD